MAAGNLLRNAAPSLGECEHGLKSVHHLLPHRCRTAGIAQFAVELIDARQGEFGQGDPTDKFPDMQVKKLSSLTDGPKFESLGLAMQYPQRPAFGNCLA